MESHEPALAFGPLLQRYRLAAGFTQEQLAELAGLSARGISDLERGINTRPRPYTLRQLSRALGLSSADDAILETAARWGGKSKDPLDGRPSGGYLGALPPGPLIGRTAEIERVREQVLSALSGERRLVLIGGEPGIGKTRLAQEVWQDLWIRGYRAASGRCYEPERHVPYYPLFEVMESVYGAAPPALRADAARTWPDIVSLLPTLGQTTLSQSGDEARLFHAVTAFLSAASRESPLGLMLDDLQWADESSLRLLAHLVRHLHVAPLFLLATYRTTDLAPHQALDDLALALSREGLLERIILEPLDKRETAHLTSVLLGGTDLPERELQRIWNIAEGNPFYTEQLVRDAIERGARQDLPDGMRQYRVPDGVRDLVGQRLARFDPSTRTVLREASVLGQTFSFEDLQGATGRSDQEIDDAVEGAIGAGFVRGVGASGYSFHALTQQALYESLAPHRRRRLHRAAGAFIERLPERVSARRADEIAWHLRLGDDPHRALHWTLVAGDEAMKVYAHIEAERSYRIAADLGRELGDTEQQAQALERLGRLYYHRAAYERAEAAYQGALALTPDTATRGRSSLYRGLAQTWAARGSVERAEALFERSEQTLGDRDRGSARQWDHDWIEIQLDRAGLYYSTGMTSALEEIVERMRPVVEAAGTESQQADFQDRVNLVGLRHERYQPSARAVEAARAFLGATMEDGAPTAKAHTGLGFMLLWNGELDEAEWHLGEAAHKARETGDRSRYAMAITYLAVVARRKGDVERVAALADELTDAAADVDAPSYIGAASAHRAWVHLRHGDLAMTRTAAQGAVNFWRASRAKRYPFQWLALWPLLAVCTISGRTEEAMEHAASLLDPALQPPPTELADLLAEARHAWDTGDREAANALLTRALSAARAGGYA